MKVCALKSTRIWSDDRNHVYKSLQMWGDVSLLAQGWYTKKEEAQGEAQEDDVQKYQEA